MTVLKTEEILIPITAEKKVSYVHLVQDLVAFKEDLIFNGEVLTSTEGIALKSKVMQATALKSVEPFKKNIKGTSNEVVLFNKEVLSFVLKNPLTVKDNTRNAFQMIIKNPYTYLKEHQVEDVVPLFIDGGSYELFDLEGELVRQGIYFGYISQNVTNYYYNLGDFLTAIENREDIVIDMTRTSSWKEPAAIKEIPYYNSNQYSTHFIEFIWTPTVEDFEKVKGLIVDRVHNRFEVIISTIFGVKRNVVED